MFKVPSNPREPSFDETQKVSFFKWLTSSREQRNEWRRLRQDAADRARRNQNIRGADKAWELIREQAQRKVTREVMQGKRTWAEAEKFMRDLDEGRPPAHRVA